MHTSSTFFDNWLNIGPLENASADAIVQKLHAAVARARPGDWVRGKQLDSSITPGILPLALTDLDSMAPNNPLFLIEANGHVGYANSKALALAGISRNSPDPPNARFVRDANGELTGRLEETNAILPFVAQMPQVTAEDFAKRVRGLFERAASVGCTGLNDCGIGVLAAEAELGVLQDIMQHDPPIRFSGFLVSSHLSRWVGMGLSPGSGNDHFRLLGMKVWSDGSNQGFTGYQRGPYLGRKDRGTLYYTPAQLTGEIRRIHELGWQIAIHANGDAAIDTTLDAYEEVLQASPRSDHRHRIEHCSVLHPEQIQRMARLNLSPSFLIGHVAFWGRAFRDRILGAERTRFYDPCASALAAGLRVSLHSDYDVTPIEPLRCVENAVTRVMREGGEILTPEERIPSEAALRAMTIDAAWQCRMDRLVGSLEVGKRADLVVLEEDPTTVEPSRIHAIRVVETWMDGRRRYAA